MKFKVGDKVRCINHKGNISIGDELIVKNTENDFGFPLSVTYYNKDNHSISFYNLESCADYFELVEDWKDEEADVHHDKPNKTITITLPDSPYNLEKHLIKKSIKEYGSFMKPKDLKVGMVFKSNGDVWIHIIEILETSIIYKIYTSIFYEDISYFHTVTIIDFINTISEYGYKLVDKVPSKTIEVEEEVPVYIHKNSYDKLIHGITTYTPLSISKIRLEDGKISEKIEIIELCKIKRKVTKEVNFNWQSGEWE